MGAVGDDLLGAVSLRAGGLAQGAGGVDHVVHDDAAAAIDFADDVHHLGDVGLGRRLSMIARSHSRRLASDRARTTPPWSGKRPGVFVILLLDVFEQDGQGVDVVDRNVEEALDLLGVQRSMVSTRSTPAAASMLATSLAAMGTREERGPAVLAGVAEIGNGGGDAAGRGALRGIDDDQQFHQVVVAGALVDCMDENVAAPHVSCSSTCASPSEKRPTLARRDRRSGVWQPPRRQFGGWRCR